MKCTACNSPQHERADCPQRARRNEAARARMLKLRARRRRSKRCRECGAPAAGYYCDEHGERNRTKLAARRGGA